MTGRLLVARYGVAMGGGGVNRSAVRVEAVCLATAADWLYAGIAGDCQIDHS